VGAGDYARTMSLVAGGTSGAKCLISFGIAGALAPGLRPGDVILSGEVIGADRRWETSESFRDRMPELARAIGAVEGPVLGARQIIANERDKAKAWRDTGALAVDLESEIVARGAEQAGIPFVVLRAIADSATRRLPPAALIPLTEDGTPALLRVFASVLRQPRQVTALIGLARETRQALAALAAPARALHGFLAAV